jgi:preprotein translocase subunit SecG
MYNFVLTVHVIVAIGLIGMILVQRGRSGGLVEALGGVESIFGTKTNSFFVKITVVLAILFFVTSVSLAYLSKQRGKSLMGQYNSTSESPSIPQGSSSLPDEE